MGTLELMILMTAYFFILMIFGVFGNKKNTNNTGRITMAERNEIKKKTIAAEKLRDTIVLKKGRKIKYLDYEEYGNYYYAWIYYRKKGKIRVAKLYSKTIEELEEQVMSV